MSYLERWFFDSETRNAINYFRCIVCFEYKCCKGQLSQVQVGLWAKIELPGDFCEPFSEQVYNNRQGIIIKEPSLDVEYTK
jgi:hypothetical protein